MKRFLATAVTLAACTATTTPSMASGNTVPLIQVAKADGYVYSYLGADDSVTLSKGTLVIYVRPGDPLFDVNDRSVAVDGPTPETMEGDVFVSPEFAKRLKKYSVTTAAMDVVHKPKTAVPMNATNTATNVATPVEQETPVAVTSLTAAQSAHDASIDITGAAAPSSEIEITLTAIIAKNLPRVTVSRRSVKTQSDGTFVANVPITNAYFTNAILEINAEPAKNDGSIKPTVATVVMQRLQEHVDTPADRSKL